MAKVNLPDLSRGIGFTGTYTHIEPMTSGKVYFTIKPTKYDTTVDDSTGVTKTVTSFTNGNLTATWTVTDADMYLTPGTYYYSIVYEGSDLQSLPPIFTGKFKLLGHPTNRQTVNG